MKHLLRTMITFFKDWKRHNAGLCIMRNKVAVFSNFSRIHMLNNARTARYNISKTTFTYGGQDYSSTGPKMSFSATSLVNAILGSWRI